VGLFGKVYPIGLGEGWGLFCFFFQSKHSFAWQFQVGEQGMACEIYKSF
jgi:hypothetical protein